MRRRAARLVGGGGPWRTALLAPVAISGERRERSGERERERAERRGRRSWKHEYISGWADSHAKAEKASKSRQEAGE
jgi:hypothetical protein